MQKSMENMVARLETLEKNKDGQKKEAIKQAKEEKVFEKTLNWVIENANGLFNTEKTPSIIKNVVFPDLKTWGVTLMAHSSGFK